MLNLLKNSSVIIILFLGNLAFLLAFKYVHYCYYEKVDKSIIKIDDITLYEIPEKWVYTRLGNIINLLSGRDLTPSDYNDKNIGIPYITGASNISNNKLIINRWTTKPVVISDKGDLLITCKGTIGTMAYNSEEQIHIARQIMAISSDYVELDYIKMFLELYTTALQSKAKSMIPGISREDIEQAMIPLPPINEQRRIGLQYSLIKKMLKSEA